MKAERHLSLVLVSHDLNVVAGCATTPTSSIAGRVVEQGRVEELFRRPRHPYTRALVSATPGATSVSTDGEATGPVGEIVVPTGGDAGDGTSGCPYLRRCPSARADCALAIPPLTSVGHGAVACFHPLEPADAAR